VTGLKATQTRVPRSGVMPLSFSADNVGPLTRTARDAARFLTITAGRKCLVIITESAGSVRNGETTKNAKRGAVGYMARVDFLA
jgi:Asp-tRNA(Asn)/Glu-tRNA(Gln) amidotransferase A subunit family amidase